MSQDVTAVEGAEQGPEWRTLKGLEAPLRMWGTLTDDYFRTAGNRNEVTGEPVVLVRLWSEQRGTARYGETADGRTVYLGGAATKFWVQAGAGEEPAVEEPAACPAHYVTDSRGTHAEALPVPRCEPGVTYGVWDELAGGFTFTEDCAMNAANWAAEQLTEDPDGEMSVIPVCREHEEQPATGCQECDQEDPEEAPAVEEPAVEEAPAPAAQEDATEPQRYTAEFETVQAHPGHQENRLTIRVLGEADPVEFYALPHIPGWTTDGFLRAFGWRAIEPGGLTYLGARRESGAVRRTVSSVSQVARDAHAALREETVARMTVRLSNGAAGHFLPVFRTGRAYPIGWTYRIGYADAALYGWVTAGGTLPDGGGVHTREAAEQELRQQDPAAPPLNGDLYGHVSGCSLWDLGRRFLAARNGELTGLPAHLTDGAPITANAARELVQRSYSQAEQFEPLQGQGGRMLGWTFRAGRLHSSRYGWVTAAGTVSKGLEPYRSTAGNVLVHADADDRESAERAAVVRSMGGRRLADNRCAHNRYARQDAQGDPVLACSMAAEGDTFGVFDSADERYDTHPCAVQAANDAARSGGWDDVQGADPQPYWAKLCPAHPFEVSGRCAACGQDTPDEDAQEAVDGQEEAGPVFTAGDEVVCADGIRRTVEGMAPAVNDEPARVIVEGGAEWIAGNCRRANREDLDAARIRSSAAAARVRSNPDPEDPEWRDALETLSEALDFLKLADPMYAHMRIEDAKGAVLTVHADAHDFQPFQRPGNPVPVAGWTFRTGHGSGARYGVVTAACTVSGVGLYEYRTTAERAFLYGQEDSGRS